MNRIGLGIGSLLLLGLGCSGKLDVGPRNTGGAANELGTGGFGGASTGGFTGDGGFVGHTGGTTIGGSAGNCVPGEVALEAQGTPAEAEVNRLDRCSEGYTCNAAKKCVPISSCAGNLAGDCLVYETPGVGGRSGTPTFNGTGGGYFGNSEATEVPPVTALAQDDSHVYFTTYGSRDRLGNFNGDGALRAVSLANGEVTTVVDGLPGAIGVGVTLSHAYLLVDGAPLIGSTTHLRVLRVALTGGTPEVVQDSPDMVRLFTFLTGGEHAFWPGREGILTMTPTDAAPRVFVPAPGDAPYQAPGAIAEDGSNLYYSSLAGSQDWWIFRKPFDGGTAEQVVQTSIPFSVHEDYAYGAESIENGTGLVLDRMAASGGTWQRVRALGAGNATRIQFAGDRFFIATNPPQVGPYVQADFLQLGVLSGLLSSDSPPVRVLERVARRTVVDTMWLGTSNKFFWSDGNNVYSRSL